MGGKKVRYDHSEDTIVGKVSADSTQKRHWLGDEIDRMRDVDHFIAIRERLVFETSNPDLQSMHFVESLGAGIEIDAFRPPAAVLELSDSFAETAGDVEEASGCPAIQLRKNTI
jgi:hypothetical protein